MRAIGEATGCSEIGVRDFLDSRHGRHFADDVAGGLFKRPALPQAINAAGFRGWRRLSAQRRLLVTPPGAPAKA